MKKRGYFIFACILALMLVGCGHKEEVKETNKTGDIRTVEKAESSDTVVENTDNDETKTTTEEKTTNNAEETIQNPSTGTTTGKNESTTTTQKPVTNNTSNNSNNTTPNTNDNTSNNNSTTPKPTQPVHEHTWVEVTEEVKHYYAWRTICGKCGTDLTDMTSDDRILHVGMVCGGRYSVRLVEVNYVTENVQTETIVTGYKCSCGEVKEN